MKTIVQSDEMSIDLTFSQPSAAHSEQVVWRLVQVPCRGGGSGRTAPGGPAEEDACELEQCAPKSAMSEE